MYGHTYICTHSHTNSLTHTVGSGQAGLAANVDWACGEIFTEHAEPICGCSSVMGGSWLYVSVCACVCVCVCVMARVGIRRGGRRLVCVWVTDQHQNEAELELKRTQALLTYPDSLLSSPLLSSPLLSSPLLSSPLLSSSSLLYPPAGRAQSLGSRMNKWRRREQQSGPSLAVSDTVDDVQSRPHTPALA